MPCMLQGGTYDLIRWQKSWNRGDWMFGQNHLRLFATATATPVLSTNSQRGLHWQYYSGICCNNRCCHLWLFDFDCSFVHSCICLLVVIESSWTVLTPLRTVKHTHCLAQVIESKPLACCGPFCCSNAVVRLDFWIGPAALAAPVQHCRMLRFREMIIWQREQLDSASSPISGRGTADANKYGFLALSSNTD